jgi:sirohydrochlorin ferrochelatase
VHLGFIKGEPSLEAALAEAGQSSGEIVVYPFLMAGGYFSGTVLPQRIEAAGLAARCRLLAPLGLDRGLPGLMTEEAQRVAQEAGYEPSHCALVIVGHGSQRGTQSKEATMASAAAVARSGVFRSVGIGLIEEPPSVAAALASLAPPIVVLGFLSGDGLHAGEDIPAAIRQAGRRALYAGSAGGLQGICELIEAAALGSSFRADYMA